MEPNLPDTISCNNQLITSSVEFLFFVLSTQMRRIYFSKNLLKYRVSKNRGVYFPLLGNIHYGIVSQNWSMAEQFLNFTKHFDRKNYISVTTLEFWKYFPFFIQTILKRKR